MGTITALGILLLVLLLELKHSICDGPLQTLWMIGEKGTYGKTGGVVHAALHAGGTLITLVVFGLPLGFSLLLSAVDGATHYHIDYFKEALVRRKGWTPRDKFFWWTLAADQTSHHVTYVALAAVVVIWAN